MGREMVEEREGESEPHSSAGRLSAHEWMLLLVLATIQFAHIVDFVILMPLGSQFINSDPNDPNQLHLSTREFGFVVAAYTISAGIASLVASQFLDRFDRKRALLFLFSGFAFGTLLCGIATTFPLLLLARAVAGAFGGVCGATVLAIVGDAFADSRRATAMGVVMSAFSLASIAGVPLGLYLAEYSGWRTPFVVLGLLSIGVVVMAAWVLPPLKGHMVRSIVKLDAWDIAFEPNHIRAFLLMASLVGSSFLIVPYLATFMVANVGMPEPNLKLIYLAGGLATLLSLTWIGRIADRRGKLGVFRVLAVAACVPFLLVTVLPYGLSMFAVLAVTTLMFITTSGRMVPGMALIANSAAPSVRGSFMSLNSAVQQLGAGLASVVGGLMLQKGDGGELFGFPFVGVLACCISLLSVYLAGHLRPAPGGALAPDEEPVEADMEPAESDLATRGERSTSYLVSKEVT